MGKRTKPETAVATRFSEAANRYEEAALIQRQAAGFFDEWLAQLDATTESAPPERIAEIGCGTGLLTRLLLARYPSACLQITDLAPAMVDYCRDQLGNASNLQYIVCDGRDARFNPTPDWIVSAMCFQWFDPLQPVLQHHLQQCGVLAFSIVLEGSFSAWREAHAAAGTADGLRPLFGFDALLELCRQLALDNGAEQVDAERITLSETHDNGLAFARSLRAIGADLPHVRHEPVNLRPVLRQLDQPFDVNYEIGFFCIRKQRAG